MSERKYKCPDCLGKGRIEYRSTEPPQSCITCNGTGDGDYFPTEEEQTEHDENYEFMRRG